MGTSSEWPDLSSNKGEVMRWCQCQHVNRSWALLPKTEQDFQGLVSPYGVRSAVPCVTSCDNCVRWPGWPLKGPVYFLLTTKQSWDTITTLTYMPQLRQDGTNHLFYRALATFCQSGVLFSQNILSSDF